MMYYWCRSLLTYGDCNEQERAMITCVIIDFVVPFLEFLLSVFIYTMKNVQISFRFSFSPHSRKHPNRRTMAGTVGQAIFSCWIWSVIMSLIAGGMVPYCFLSTPCGVNKRQLFRCFTFYITLRQGKATLFYSSLSTTTREFRELPKI